MQIKQISYSSHFLRNLKKLPKDQKEILSKRQIIFKKDCFDPRLKTHKLTGKLKDYRSFSITHSFRVLFVFQGNGKVGFIDVGGHSIYR